MDVSGKVATVSGLLSLIASTSSVANSRTSNENSKTNSNEKNIRNEIVWESETKSAEKLNNQILRRGWTKDLVTETVDNPYTKRMSINKATGNSATVYYTKQGSYVIVDDVTKSVVQISDNTTPSTWVPDSSIIDPYITS